MASSSDGSWTRALMASSGIAVGHREGSMHASPEQREAEDPATALARLQKLAIAADEGVRATVAGRPDCPLGILAALAHDRRTDVRVGVAGNPRITDAISEHLSRDRDVRVLKALARNSVVTPTIVEALALHRKGDVRRVASREIDSRWGVADAPRPSMVQREGLPMELRDRVAAMAPPRLDYQAGGSI